MPWWVRAWSRVPLIDRFADEWMWFHGGFLVVPPDHPLLQMYGPEEYEALAGMPRAEYERQLIEYARKSFREDHPNGVILESVDIQDARLVVLFRLPNVPGQRFGWESTVWPSPHPDDYSGTPEWGDAVATFVDAAVEEPEGETEAPDEDGVIWLSPRA
jgi:hypothetical protein